MQHSRPTQTLWQLLFGGYRRISFVRSMPANTWSGEKALSSFDQAALMLRSKTALLSLSEAQAKAVVGYMTPQIIESGCVIFHEGDTEQVDHMLLIISGEVSIETLVPNRKSMRTHHVLGPGSLVGEMALFDGGPRSATCLANTRVCCAVLTRQAVEALTRDDPSTATRLLAAIAQRLSERLREADSKTRLFGQLVNTLQQEINLLMH